MTLIRTLCITLVMASLAACSSYQGMFFAEHTHVGAQIKISPETDNKPLDVNIGYDRGLLAVVPRTESGGNAGSVISKTDLDIVFTTNSLIKNVFATGKAAKNITKEGERVAALFGECFNEEQALKTRKKGAIAHLDKIRDDAAKLEGLYQEIFPNRTVHFTTTKTEMYRRLRARVIAICFSEEDDETLKKYEAL